MIPSKPLNRVLDALPLDDSQRKDLQYYIEHGTSTPTPSSDTNIPFNYKLEDYLHYMVIDKIDYTAANDYFEKLYGGMQPVNFKGGACSAGKFGNFFIRNYDWNYTNDTEFVVRTPRTKDRFASIGVATNIGVTDAMVAKGDFNNKLDYLPFYTTCGINENGVAVSINVVPKDMGNTNQHTGKQRMCALMIPRYVLDHAKSARHAAVDILTFFDFYCTPNYEFHFIISDINETVIIEFIENKTIETTNWKTTQPTERPFITNFHIEKTNAKEYQVDWGTVERYGQGVERYEFMWKFMDAHLNPTIDVANELLHELHFTKAYRYGEWLTEFAGLNGLTVQDAKNNPSLYNEVLKNAQEAFNNRTRDGYTWQTMHSCCYDLEEKKMYIGVQEQPLRYTFECDHDIV